MSKDKDGRLGPLGNDIIAVGSKEGPSVSLEEFASIEPAMSWPFARSVCTVNFYCASSMFAHAHTLEVAASSHKYFSSWLIAFRQRHT